MGTSLAGRLPACLLPGPSKELLFFKIMYCIMISSKKLELFQINLIYNELIIIVCCCEFRCYRNFRGNSKTNLQRKMRKLPWGNKCRCHTWERKLGEWWGMAVGRMCTAGSLNWKPETKMALLASMAGVWPWLLTGRQGQGGQHCTKTKKQTQGYLPMHHTAYSSSHTYTSPDLVKETYVVLFPIACFGFLCWH